MVGDSPLSDGGGYPLQATPLEQPERVAPTSKPKAAKTTPVRSTRAPQGKDAGRRAAIAGQVKRAVLESTVEDMLRDRILRK